MRKSRHTTLSSLELNCESVTGHLCLTSGCDCHVRISLLSQHLTSLTNGSCDNRYFLSPRRSTSRFCQQVASPRCVALNRGVAFQPLHHTSPFNILSRKKTISHSFNPSYLSASPIVLCDQSALRNNPSSSLDVTFTSIRIILRSRHSQSSQQRSKYLFTQGELQQ